MLPSCLGWSVIHVGVVKGVVSSDDNDDADEIGLCLDSCVPGVGVWWGSEFRLAGGWAVPLHWESDQESADSVAAAVEGVDAVDTLELDPILTPSSILVPV